MNIIKKGVALFLAVVMIGMAAWTPSLEAAAADSIVSGTFLRIRP